MANVKDLMETVEKAEREAVEVLRNTRNEDKNLVENSLLYLQQIRLHLGTIIKRERERSPSPEKKKRSRSQSPLPLPPPQPTKREKKGNGIFVRKTSDSKIVFTKRWLEENFRFYGNIEETYVPQSSHPNGSWWSIVRFETDQGKQKCLDYSNEIFNDFQLEIENEKRRDKK